MAASRPWLFAALIVVVIGVAAILVGKQSTAGRATEAALLRVTLVDPIAVPGGAVIGEPGQIATLSFDVRNVGPQALDGLSAELNCECQKVGEFPTSLGAGQTERVKFRFRVPDAGVSRTTIPVLQGGKLIGVIEAALKADVSPPLLLSPLEPLQAIMVCGAKTAAKLTFRTLEREAAPTWIEGLRISPSGDFTAAIEAVHEQPPLDPGVIRRNYVVRIDLADASEQPADFQGEATVMFRPGSGDERAAPVRFPLTIKFKAPLVLIPDKVVFRLADQSNPSRVRLQTVWRGTTTRGSLTVVSAPDWITVTIQENPDAGLQAEDLLISVKDPGADSMSGQIVLGVRGQDKVRVSVPVEFIADEAP